GDNDLASPKTPQRVLEDYQKFVKHVRELGCDAPIGFISIKPSPTRISFLPQAKEANALVKDFIDQDKSQFYIDVFTPMLGADGKPRIELFGPDGLHMNAKGYRLWQQIIGPKLK